MMLTLCLAGAAMAADVTGKWVSERKMTPPGGGEERTVTITMDLKADGAKLTGSVTTSMGGGQAGRAVEITDGKIDGNKVSFKVTREGKQGAMTTVYTATVEGDTMKGEAGREGGNRMMPFEAKRAK
jgi:hypothetical protein